MALLLLALLLFDLQSVIIKHLGDRYPVQLLACFRNLFGLIPSLLVLWFSAAWQADGRPFGIRQWRLGLARGAMIAGAQYCMYLSLTLMELATASTLAFIGPVLITLLSVPILGHRIGIWRWLAVLTGFAGVVLIMSPGDLFSWFSLLPLGAALGYATSTVCVRLMDARLPTPLINLYASVGALTGALAILVSTGAWQPVESALDWLLLLSMGIIGGCAVLCLIYAYRLAPPSSLSPFEYFGIPFAFVLGWVFFAEAPFDKLLPGVFLIVAGGLLITWREHRARGGSIPAVQDG